MPTSYPKLHSVGHRAVQVAPIQFLADHLEILYDVDVEARAKAAELGLALERTASLNDDPAFAAVLADLAIGSAARP